jgi:hypothetical protein
MSIYVNRVLTDPPLKGGRPKGAYARQTAEQFGLRYEEIEGSDTLIRKMVYGPWDEAFVVVEPGGIFLLESFLGTPAPGPRDPAAAQDVL